MNQKFDTSKFDEAAAKAAKEFPTAGTAQDVAAWWNTWFPTAGHKRLAYIMLSAFGLRENRYAK